MNYVFHVYRNYFSASFSGTVSLSILYDDYLANESKLEGDTNKEEDDTMIRSRKPPVRNDLDRDTVVARKMLTAAKVIERMVNINTFEEIAQDFRFYEEPADDATYPEGSLMPLWRFKINRKDIEVTGLQWNPKYHDLFGVSYGSFDFYQKCQESMLCLFSLKNPSYPEYTCKAHCGIMCLDIHDKYPHMVAVGLYDGNIAVYNFASKCEDPMYVSNAAHGKHADPVWQIKWAKDNLDGYLNFYSISGDGRVTNWTLLKTSMWFKDELKVSFNKSLSSSKEKRGPLFDGARSIAFQPDRDSQFLIGTEEGDVYLATTEYSSDFLTSYHGHVSPINKIMWNPHYPLIFISCAAEHILYIWHKDLPTPILHFDLGSCVGDVAWAPYSSTVFAAVTGCGRVFVFDILVSKYKPICKQVRHQR